MTDRKEGLMATAISMILGSASVTALLVVWFIHANQVLSRKKQDLIYADEQVRLLRTSFREAESGPEEASAGKMLETSLQIYNQIEGAYHQSLQKPMYQIPGFLMGFRKMKSQVEKEEQRL